METILITGGTGMIGTVLTQMLTAKGYAVIILTRGEKVSDQPNVSFAEWDAEKQTIDTDALKKADHIIHLAGANVGEKRWTKKRKKEIVESRTKTGELLVKVLRENENKVNTVVSASAIGWYGPDTEETAKNGFKEDAPAYEDFLGSTCKVWESSIQPVEALGKRLVYLRTGIVLSNDGGAFTEFKKPLNFGVAAILGSGKQIISWIHIEDICRMYIHAIENNINGIYNAVAPEPVTNKSFTIQLAKKIRNKYYIPIHVPSFALKMVLGEMSIEVLKSATINNDKIRNTGFKFFYPSLDSALNELVKK